MAGAVGIVCCGKASGAIPLGAAMVVTGAGAVPGESGATAPSVVVVVAGVLEVVGNGVAATTTGWVGVGSEVVLVAEHPMSARNPSTAVITPSVPRPVMRICLSLQEEDRAGCATRAPGIAPRRAAITAFGVGARACRRGTRSWWGDR